MLKSKKYVIISYPKYNFCFKLCSRNFPYQNIFPLVSIKCIVIVQAELYFIKNMALYFHMDTKLICTQIWKIPEQLLKYQNQYPAVIDSPYYLISLLSRQRIFWKNSKFFLILLLAISLFFLKEISGLRRMPYSKILRIITDAHS